MAKDTGELYADDDPEYALDASDDIDIEGAGVEPVDPKKMPKDQGDIGSAEPPAGMG